MSEFTEVQVPTTPPSDPTVFVIVNGTFGTGNVSGTLMHADGSAGWSHISSSEGWLVRDLVMGFPDRRAELLNRYGGSVNYAVIRGWGAAPGWLHEANDAWADAQDAEAAS